MRIPSLIQVASFALVLVLISCKKSGDIVTPDPVVVPKQDTLTAGWTKLTYGKTTFADIFFQDQNTGYAGGSFIYRTTNGGISWDSIGPSSVVNLFATPNGQVFYTTQRNEILKSVDKGVNFAKTSLGLMYYDLYFTGNDTGYASANLGSIITTTNGGTTWSSTPISPDFSASSSQTSSLFFIDATTGWVTNGLSISKTNGSINSWTKCNIAVTIGLTEAINSLFAPSKSIVYAGCRSGKLLKSTDGGLNFSLLKQFPASSGYMDIQFFDDLIGYTVYDKKFYKTADGGANWQTVVSMGDDSLVEIHFTDPNHGWACGSNGAILRFNQ